MQQLEATVKKMLLRCVAAYSESFYPEARFLASRTNGRLFLRTKN